MNKGKYRVCPRSIRIWTFLGALIFPILLNDADAQQVNFRQTQTSEETSIDQVHHGSPPPSVLTNPESKTLNTSEIGDFIFDIVAILDKAPTKDVRVTFEIINEPHLILLDGLTIDPNEITLNSQNWYSGEQVTISHQGNQPPVEGQLEIRIAPEGGTNTVEAFAKPAIQIKKTPLMAPRSIFLRKNLRFCKSLSIYDLFYSGVPSFGLRR